MREVISITADDGIEYGYNTHGYIMKLYERIRTTLYGSIYLDDRWYACEWDAITGKSLDCTDSSAQWGDYSITPIKKPWYEDEANFPCLVSTVYNIAFVSSMSKIHDYLDSGWKLATKAEVESLYYKDK